MMTRSKYIIAWLLLLGLLFNWQPLFSNQSGAGLELPEVVVIGEDSARLEGFRDFGLLPKLAPGIKLEPVADNLTLKDDAGGSGPGWETAQTQAPGCAYRNALTASLARGFNGAEGYYRSGRQKYIDGLLLEAQNYFKRGLDKFRESPLVPDFHYWLGEIDFRQENYTLAHSHFAVVAQSPAHRFYHFSCYSLAWLDFRERNYEAAVKWFAIAAESRERRLASAALFWESEALFQSNKKSAGRTILLQLVSEYPEAAEYRAALYRLATLAFNQRDYEVSLAYLTAMPAPAAGSDMLQRQADLARGWCSYFLESYGDAENFFRQLQDTNAGVDNVVPLAFLGEILAQLKQAELSQARAVFARRPEPLRVSPTAAAALRELAEAFSVATDSESAVALGEELVSTFPVTLLQIDDFRRLARLQAELGQNQQALQTLKTGIEVFKADGKSDEELISLRLEQAQILYAAEEFELAAITLERLFAKKSLIKSTVDRSLVYLLLARTLNRSADYSRTLMVLTPLPADFTMSRLRDLLYERGWAALQSGNFKMAANDFAAYLKLARESDVSRQVIQNAEINQAEALFNLHQDRETAVLLDRFVKHWPQSSFLSRVLNYQGLLALRRGDFETAEAIFSELAASDLKADTKLESEVLYNLGESLFSLEKYPEAITIYQELADKNPRLKLSGQALIRIGESYFNQGDYLKSQLVYLRAKQFWPGGEIDEKASYGMLLLAYNQDKFSYLETEVKSFIRRFPDSSYTVPLMLLLVDLYQRQGREADLIKLFKKLETGDYADDLQLEAYYRYFTLELRKGRREDARKACQRLLKRFPLSKYECDCRLYLADYDFSAGRPKNALAVLVTMQGSGCPDPDLKRKVILLKAQIYQQLGELEKSRKHYLVVAEDRQSSETQTFQAFIGIGDIFVQKKEYDEALFFYDKAMQNPVKSLAATASLKHAATLESAGRIKDARNSYLRISYLYPEQNKIVGEALLAALRIAKQEKDAATAKKMIEKLNSIELNQDQRREFEKIMAL